VIGNPRVKASWSSESTCAKLRPMRNVALFFHLLGALLFVAGIVVAGVAFEAARRRHRPEDIALLLGLTRVGVALVGAGAVLVLGFGLWLVHLGGFGYGASWVDAALVLYVAALALGALGGQRPRQARRMAAELAAAGAPATDELRTLLADRRSLAASYAATLAVLAILALMVFRP
jgi:uncharacterized membrane protein